MTATVTRPPTSHVRTDPAILYLGTPVVLLSTRNPDRTTNLAPISSVFWLGDHAALGIAQSGRSAQNIARTGEVVLCLPSVDLVDAVDRLALSTGRPDVPARKRERGYRYEPDKLGLSGLTPVASDLVAPPRLAECPVAMEAVVRRHAPAADQPGMPLVEVQVVRTHAHPDVLVPGSPDRIDPDRWRPLIMSFQHFYGLTERVHPSRLAGIAEELYR